MVTDIVRKAYRDYILRAPIPKELKRALGTHERIPAFIDNLAKEVRGIDIIRKQKMKRPMTKAQIVWLAESMTEVFITGVRNQAKARMLSPLAHQAIQTEQDHLKILEQAADGIVPEELADMGVSFDDSREVGS